MAENTVCTIGGCGKSIRARGWCSGHYQRYQRTGDPVPESQRDPEASPIESLLARITLSGSCWIWTGATVAGYGAVKRDRRKVRAHRYVYEAMVAPIPEGLVLDHLCRVTRCVNPDHLEAVTIGENVRRGHAGKHMRIKYATRGDTR